MNINKYTVIFFLVIFFAGCSKTDDNQIKNENFPDYFSDKFILSIRTLTDETIFLSGRLCNECNIPPWQSSIPYKYQLSILKNNSLLVKEDVKHIQNLIKTSDNDFVCIKDNNIVKYNGLNEVKTIYEAPVNNYLTSFALDSDNNLWIGTLNAGLYKISNTDTVIYNSQNMELPSNEINQVLIDKTNTKWILLGSPNTGFLQIKDNQKKYYKISDIIGTGNFYNSKLAIDKNNTIWAFISNQEISNLYTYDGVDWKQKNIIISGSVINEKISNIFMDEESFIWVFTIQNKLFYYNGLEWNQLNCDLTNNSVLSISRNNNQVYIGTNNGLKIANLN